MKPIYLILALPLLLAAAATRADSVDDYIQEQMRKQHIPGLSLAVVKDGHVVKSRGYGFANLEHAAPARPETVYQLASVTKQFTAAAIMLLVQDGKLRLDDPVSRYVDGTPDAWKEITVHHLLTHTSGIKDYLNELRENTRQDTTPAKIVQLVTDKPLNFAPGSRWSYSNTGYVLLGMIVQRVSGTTYDAFLAERAFKPLGMLSTRRDNPEDVIPNRAAGYVLQQGRLRNAEYLNPTLWDNGDGGMITSVQDLVKWDAALSGDRLLSAETRKQMWSPVRLTSGGTHDYGFGWVLDAINGHHRVQHTGGRPGAGTAFMRYVDDGVTVILLTNGGGANPDGLAQGVARRYIPTLLPPRKFARLDPKRLNACAGYYDIPGALATLTVENGRVAVSIDGHLIEELRPLSETKFASEDTLRELTVERAPDGEVLRARFKISAGEIPMTRVAAIPPSSTPPVSPSTEAARHGEAFLRAFASEIRSPDQIPHVASGLRGPLGGGGSPFGGRVMSPVLLADEDVRARSISRHGETISRLLIYRVTVDGSSRRVFLYLTPGDLVADIDVTDGTEGSGEPASAANRAHPASVHGASAGRVSRGTRSATTE